MTLKSLAHVITKGTTPTKAQGYIDNGINFIRALSIDKNGQLVEGTFLKISNETNASLKRSVVQEGDVLFTIAGVIGRVTVVEKKHLPANLNQALAIIRPKKDKISSGYLANLLRSHDAQFYLKSRVVESVQANLSLAELGSFPVENISLEVQNIRNNTLEIIENKSICDSKLSDISRTLISSLFRSWFIDFDPVKAKMEGKLPYGMDEETAALFPDSFEDSEIGSIPLGWRSIEISKISLCNDGDWIELKDQGGSDYRLVQPSNIGLGSFVETGNFRYITDKTFQRLNCIQIEPSDVLVARMPDPKGNVGRAYLWTQDVPKAITSVDVCIIRVDNNQVTPKYLESYLNSYDSLERSKSFMTGTTHPRIRRKDIESFRILVPPISILEQFEKRVQAMSDLKTLVVKQNSSLSTTRDALLPRLMSGELKVN